MSGKDGGNGKDGGQGGQARTSKAGEGRRWTIAAFLALLLAASCASLPSYDVLREAGSARPQVAGRRGLLPPEKSERVLQGLEQQDGGNLLRRHFSFMAALGGGPLVTGNKVTLLEDGPATYAAMFAAIDDARDSIDLEAYILDDDEIGLRFAQRLIDKQAQGVQVNLMYDGVGTFGTPSSFFQRLRAAGVSLCEFNPVGVLPGNLLSLNNRDHRKMLVVDGRTAFTGGVNISNVYAGSSFGKKREAQKKEPWRDTHVEIQGPAAREFQQLFFNGWHSQSCPAPAERHYFPETPKMGDTVVQALGSEPGDKINLIYASLLSAISHASKSVHITMAYFVPNPQFIDALKKAASRGVEVKLVMPGFSDYWVTLEAGRSHYTELLESGVKIYERRDALLHAKTAVIDGVWSTVGSSNMDFRSFLHNNEVNAVVLGADFAGQMEKMFSEDVQDSTEVSPAQWKERGAKQKVEEGFARLWEYWL